MSKAQSPSPVSCIDYVRLSFMGYDTKAKASVTVVGLE